VRRWYEPRGKSSEKSKPVPFNIALDQGASKQKIEAMTTFKTLFTIVAVSVVLIGGVFAAIEALPDYGTMLEFNSGELYYTENVTEEEAQKLGEFFVETELFDGVEKTVQLDKINGVYQIRMVTKTEFLDDPEIEACMRVYGKDICNEIFTGAPVEMHMTNDSLETVRVLKVVKSYGERLEFKAGELYYTPAVTEDEANALGEYLVENEFFNDDPKTVQLNKSDGIYEFRMVVKQGFDPGIMEMIDFRQFAKQVSDGVFDSQPVDIHMTDMSLHTLKIATSTNDTDRENAINGNPFSLITEDMMQQIGQDLLDEKFK